jgi:glycerophosphoryl diester phosphodiesterase
MISRAQPLTTPNNNLGGDVRIIGHRGAASVAPENTLEGIARAFEDGADAVEIDVRLTEDEIPVLMHDPAVTDPEGRVRAVSAITRAALRRAAPSVPTLADAWDAAGGRLVIEIKGEWGSPLGVRTALVVVGLLRGRDPSGAVVSSFDVLALDAVATSGLGVATGVLTSLGFDATSNIEACIAGGHRFSFVPGEQADASTIAAAHHSGLLIVPWTVNDPAALIALRDAGADGVITDDPAVAHAALESKR